MNPLSFFAVSRSLWRLMNLILALLLMALLAPLGGCQGNPTVNAPAPGVTIEEAVVNAQRNQMQYAVVAPPQTTGIDITYDEQGRPVKYALSTDAEGSPGALPLAVNIEQHGQAFEASADSGPIDQTSTSTAELAAEIAAQIEAIGTP